MKWKIRDPKEKIQIEWWITASKEYKDMFVLHRRKNTNHQQIQLPFGSDLLVLIRHLEFIESLSNNYLKIDSSWEFNKFENEFIYVGREKNKYYIEIETCPEDLIGRLKFTHLEVKELIVSLRRF